MNENKQDFDELNLENILKEFGDSGEMQTGEEEESFREQTDQPDVASDSGDSGKAGQESPADQDGNLPEEENLPDCEEEIAPEEPEEEKNSEPEEEADGEKHAPEAEQEETTETGDGENAGETEQIEPFEDAEKAVSPAPIVFDPRSHLRELKRKLIAGPEKRYYELSELGVGKLQLAILLSLAVILLSAFAGTLYAFDLVSESRIRLMVFCQILAMLFGALLGCYQIMDGIGDLFHGKFTLKTMLFVSLLASCVDALFCLKELRVPLCAAFTLQVTMALWSEYHRRTTEMGQMDSMRKAIHLHGVTTVDDYWGGQTGILRSEGDIEDFMDHYRETSAPEKIQNIYALASLLVSAGVAAVAAVLHSLSMGVQIFSTTLLVAVPASFFVTTTRPAAVLERRLHALGTVLCSWKGVQKLSVKAVYPLRDEDMFPAGSVKLNGVKFYGERDPEVTIAYAAALAAVGGGGLAPAFRQLLESHNGPKYRTEKFQTYNGGVGGEICGESVLMGSSQFLQEMGVEIPAGTMVNHAAYVAIDGEFSGLFAVNYARMKFSASGMATLCAYRSIRPLIMTDDFLITPQFLKEKFGVSTRRLVFPTREERDAVAAKVPEQDVPALALTTNEGLAPVAYAVTGARTLRMACRLGLTVHMIGGILGMLIMAALAVIGAVELLTPLNILLYQLVWMIPGLLVTEWTRAI